MVSLNPQISPVVVNNHISVKAAADLSGYSLQYLRRLLRNGKLEGFKIGQVWLIEKTIFEAYLKKAVQATDRRFGPQ
ncbi:helix-turn-helix domain-containing protein [bacterium]|nr:helix-turn-helix domain-containing protein [bacterium]